MRLLLIRHADAGERDPARWPDDTHRPVSAKGKKRHRRVARRLRRRGLAPGVLFTSPWLRAWQTAELTAAVTGCPGPVRCEALAAPPDVAALARAVGPRDPDALVALVGHEPWLGELAALLLTGEAHGLAIDFPKSGVLALGAESMVPGGAVLEFFLRPKEE
jgi:phosphohistidine phosphatase